MSPDGTLFCTRESGLFSPPTFWRVGPASISKAKTALKLKDGIRLSLAADNDTVLTSDGFYRLSTGKQSSDPSGSRSLERAFSRDSAEAIFVVSGEGFDRDISLWKPGSDERVAKLRSGPSTEHFPSVPVFAQAKHIFYVTRTGTAVFAGHRGVGIWHAEPRKPPAPEKGN